MENMYLKSALIAATFVGVSALLACSPEGDEPKSSAAASSAVSAEYPFVAVGFDLTESALYEKHSPTFRSITVETKWSGDKAGEMDTKLLGSATIIGWELCFAANSMTKLYQYHTSHTYTDEEFKLYWLSSMLGVPYAFLRVIEGNGYHKFIALPVEAKTKFYAKSQQLDTREVTDAVDEILLRELKANNAKEPDRYIETFCELAKRGSTAAFRNPPTLSVPPYVSPKPSEVDLRLGRALISMGCMDSSGIYLKKFFAERGCADPMVFLLAPPYNPWNQSKRIQNSDEKAVILSTGVKPELAENLRMRDVVFSQTGIFHSRDVPDDFMAIILARMEEGFISAHTTPHFFELSEGGLKNQRIGAEF